MKLLQSLPKNLVLVTFGVVLALTLGTAFAAWNTTKNTGDTLTAADWNNLVISVESKLGLSANGNLGVGITTPSSKLTVAGTIESTTGGIKFPNGTTQITAAVTSETDPQVGTLTNGKWCTSDGSAVHCTSDAPGGGAVSLYGGIHTSTQCVANYGLLRNTVSGYLCQFTGNSCPSGWTRLSNWGVTVPGSGPCSTSSHEFSNISPEICQYECWQGICYNGASINAVGCY